MYLGEAHGLLLRRLSEVIAAVPVVHALVAGVAVLAGSALDVGGVREDLLVVVLVLFGLPRRTGDRVVLTDFWFILSHHNLQAFVLELL